MTRGEVNLEQGQIISLPSRGDWVVVSHDCDIAHKEELLVELIQLISIREADGNRTKAKNVRELHIDHNGGTFKLTALSKEAVNKSTLIDIFSKSQLDESNLRILQKWLACRYKRQSIPEDLNSIVRNIFEDSAKKTKDTNNVIDGLFIAYEEIDSEKHEYELSVKVVYDSGKVDGDKKAALLCDKILSKLAHESKIHLNCCESVSDEEFTFADAKVFVEYRLDFLCD